MLETVVRLFHRQGYNTTGVNQIVAGSDVVKSGIYETLGEDPRFYQFYEWERDSHDTDAIFEGALVEGKLFRADWPVEEVKSIIQTIYIRQNGTETSPAAV